MPPRLYNQIARVLAVQEGNSEIDNARYFALVNIALADAGIATRETKYHYDFWRPIVGIRHADRDGNPFTIADRGWTPVGSPGSNQGPSRMTPSFPAYVSGHSSFGTAMFQVLTRYYGTDRMNFCVISDEFNGITTDAQGNVRPEVDRCYSVRAVRRPERGAPRRLPDRPETAAHGVAFPLSSRPWRPARPCSSASPPGWRPAPSRPRSRS
ncbi:vanadium-dependent haloperoxidase [Sorangium sp. So ce590]|uniref:vanadium-dependent haloperoxidase n=1 Tax=Sorangium sp. So ce590 TaxID=3133317 RepID=UPI003F5FF5F4